MRQYVRALGVVSCLMASSAPAAAQDPQQEKKDNGFGVPDDSKALAKSLFKNAMETTKLVHELYPFVKAIIDQNPFALIDAIAAALGPGGAKADISVTAARDEILAEIRKTREEGLVARSNSILSRFQELTDDPRNMIANDRLANYVDDASDLFHDIQLILRGTDPAHRELAYHLATTYNSVTSSRIAGLATAGWAQPSIDRVYVDAIDTNTYLVSGPAESEFPRYDGYLYGYVVEELNWDMRPYTDTGSPRIWCISPPNAPADFQPQVCHPTTLGCSGGEVAPWGDGYENAEIEGLCRADILLEAHARFDSDPIVYAIRESSQEQLIAAFSNP